MSGKKKDFNGITISVGGDVIGKIKEWKPEYPNKNKDDFSGAIVPTNYKPSRLVEMKVSDPQIASWWKKEIECSAIHYLIHDEALLRTDNVRLANRTITDQLEMCGFRFDEEGKVEIPAELAGELMDLMLSIGYRIENITGGEWESSSDDTRIIEDFHFNYVSIDKPGGTNNDKP
jgi:hypothetical protein